MQIKLLLNMQTTSLLYLSRAETWLLITTLVYFLMNGAQIFETAVIVPKWTKYAPESFQLLQGSYALDLKTFWIIIHSIHELTFIAAIFFCWDLGIRNVLLFLFVIHFAVRVWTLVYFAPNIIAFQKTTKETDPTTGLLRKVKLWKSLNYLRVSVFIAVSIGLALLYISLVQLNVTIY